MRNTEYDRFGPWILEISEIDQPPQLFLPFLRTDMKPIFEIKIPRGIERRNAVPGMDLYDYVISMYNDDFDIHKREGGDVISRCFRYEQIICLSHTESLLSGHLEISTEAECFDLPFNTVSSAIIQRLVDIIRERYIDDGAERVESCRLPREKVPDDDDLGFYFSSIMRTERRENPQRILFAWQNRIDLKHLDGRKKKKLFNRISSKQLLESMHFFDGRELKITGRGQTYRYLSQPVYGKQDVYIPLKRISSAEVEDAEEGRTVRKCRLNTAAAALELVFASDNETTDNYRRLVG